ncbi:MAG: UDP-3-O-[3-hydroxymyristoyl] N-acetylglucosamine deacetylase [Lentisphaerae bacterium]|nr:UDP-3-O-[3-hydroxymyristoyl] N-acetylglucosamine deacetylase [Lentisphaerota bacterium]MCP4102985.1 UDP-3-O-[3-hydroxymyristoyl] N-acetylglucosamine deacetylase [Lentisphaerota bacterium]
MEKQRTLKNQAFLSGIALHTGARATLKILPAEPNSGITFRRVDMPGNPEVKALATNVVDARRGTTIGNQNTVVYTVEHIMSALHVCGVDNTVVEMDGQEPPIADGSAKPYLKMILEAGTVEQDAPAEFWTCKSPIYVEGNDTKLVVTPSDELKISCLASFEGCPFDPQYLSATITPDFYRDEIAPARTFVLFRDLEQLLAMGLVKGGSLDNAAILHDGAIICKEELRYRDEIVRHKILDIIGDILLCGRRVKANIIAIKPGHYFNVQLAGEMIKQMMNK